MISVGELSSSAGVAFGTSGVRGLVSSLTPELCYAYTAAFIQSICLTSSSSTTNKKSIAIAMDLRPSSPNIVKACIQAIKDADYDVVFCGAIPTPALAYYSMSNNIPCIMVTGSHIPFDRNGIKFYRADGEISKADEFAIIKERVTIPDRLQKEVDSSLLPIANLEAESQFQSRYTSLFSHIPNVLSGMHIGFYQHSSVARDLLTSTLEALGAKVSILERTNVFVPIDTEAVSSEDKQKGLEWGKRHFDALISTDGDGDRPLIGDEVGNWLRGDIVGILCAEYLQASHVVTPVNSNSALELSSIHNSVRTRIGSPYVIAGMEALRQDLDQASKEGSTKIVGYEANGGFLVGSDISLNGKILTALPTRDCFLPIILLLVQAKEQGKKLSQLADHLPLRFTASDRSTEFSREKSHALLTSLTDSVIQQSELFMTFSNATDELKTMGLNQLDGLRMTLNNGEIVHLRPSGNAPELRCYAEADSNARAEEIVKAALTNIIEA